MRMGGLNFILCNFICTIIILSLQYMRWNPGSFALGLAFLPYGNKK
jgi:hypothetical protein